MGVPCHFDMFEFNTEAPDLFVRTCEELEQSCRRSPSWCGYSDPRRPSRRGSVTMKISPSQATRFTAAVTVKRLK